MTPSSNVMVGGVAVDTSQFDLSDHSSDVGHVRTTNITLITFVGLFVWLRIVVRSFIVRKVFLDDGMSGYSSADFSAYY